MHQSIIIIREGYALPFRFLSKGKFLRTKNQALLNLLKLIMDVPDRLLIGL